MTNLLETKKKQVELAVSAIEKQFGKGSIAGKIPDVAFQSSGDVGINDALGGGWTKGRIIEIYGPESSGKTTLALHAIAEAQKAGEICAFIDVEHAFDPTYAAALGVDVDALIFSQPDSGEQALGIVELLTESGGIGTIVIDSVAALVPQKELEGEMGDAVMGAQARLMSQALRKLTAISSKSGTTLFFINQLRMKIGVMFGNPETTTGGNALKFYASQRVDVRRIGTVKDGTGDDAAITGNDTRIKVVKNKIAPPFREYEFVIRYGEGIDTMASLVRTAVKKGIIQKSGAWYNYNEKPLGQGESKIINELKTNQKLREEIIAKLQ